MRASGHECDGDIAAHRGDGTMSISTPAAFAAGGQFPAVRIPG